DDRIQPCHGEVLLPGLEHDRSPVPHEVADVVEVALGEHHGATPTGRRDGAVVRPIATRLAIPRPSSGRGTIPSASPARTMNPGIPHTTLDASSCTITRPPACESRCAPRRPSLPIPVITTPSAWDP